MASSRKKRTAEKLHYDEDWSREAATLHVEGADADDERFQCLGSADQQQNVFAANPKFLSLHSILSAGGASSLSARAEPGFNTIWRGWKCDLGFSS
jgi:hypothetical protein